MVFGEGAGLTENKSTLRVKSSGWIYFLRRRNEVIAVGKLGIQQGEGDRIDVGTVGVNRGAAQGTRLTGEEGAESRLRNGHW